eukprot:symbB.v1.2.039130.t1/scaffold6068.1/size21218/3
MIALQLQLLGKPLPNRVETMQMAIGMWVADMSDGPGHCQIVGNYFHFNPVGGWKNIQSVDISKTPQSNPMWVVTAVKA